MQLLTTFIKVIYSEEATKFFKISTLLLSYIVPVKGIMSQNCVAYSEYMNFTKGPFLFYVKVFRGFFEPPTHLRKDIFTT